MKIVNKAPKARFEFITVSAIGDEVGGVLIDHGARTHRRPFPRIITEFGWFRTTELAHAVNLAVWRSSPRSPEVMAAAEAREIDVTGTLATVWADLLKTENN